MRQWFNPVSFLISRSIGVSRYALMGSSHALSQGTKVLAALESDGYGDVQAVKDFREELREEAKT